MLNASTRTQLRGSYAPLSAGVTHFELSGPTTGELVFLVPGLTIPLFYWDGLARLLHDRGYRTLAYSAYGRGYSDRVIATYDTRLFLRQARDLLEYLGLRNEVRHVIGTSLGAILSMTLLHEDWFSADSLTLIGPAGLEAKLPLAARLAKLNGVGRLFAMRFGRQGVIKHLHHNVLSQQHAQALKAMVGSAFNYEGSIYALFSTLRSFPLINQQRLYKRTGQLGIPVLVAWGREDQITPISGMETVKQLLKPTESHVIEQCGHMAPFERPEQVAQLFTKFQSRIRRDASRSHKGFNSQ